jgi:hypothetical protein
MARRFRRQRKSLCVSSQLRSPTSSEAAALRGSFAQEGGSSDGTQRRSKEMTLAESTTERDEPTELLGGLDSVLSR